MTPDVTALHLAIRLNSLPSQVRAARAQPLPSGIPLLLAVAAGEPEALAQACESLERTADAVTSGARFYVEQVLLIPGVSSYRALGLGPDASAADLRRHLAWYLKFLHPDRDREGEHAALALRATAAWEDLKTPERRQSYDLALKAREARDAEAAAHARAQASRKARSQTRRTVVAASAARPSSWLGLRDLFRSLF